MYRDDVLCSTSLSKVGRNETREAEVARDSLFGKVGLVSDDDDYSTHCGSTDSKAFFAVAFAVAVVAVFVFFFVVVVCMPFVGPAHDGVFCEAFQL